jgi:large subunit ribosomal protein L23
MSTKQENRSMTVEKASSIIIKPYITEKTFNLIEKENKLTFIVAEKASKDQIVKALQIKKAFIKIKGREGARDLATKMGLV